MAFVINDRVRETSTAVGTGAFTLQGAISGFVSFGVGIGDGNTTYYAALSPGTGEWEVGLATYDGLTDTLSRDVVLTSSNGNALVNFTAGVKTLWCTQPASKAVFVDDNNRFASMEPLAHIPNALLENSSITINGDAVSLGGSTTITVQVEPLSFGDGLSGSTFNGTAPVTVTVAANVLRDADIGVAVQPFDPNLLDTADIGVIVQAFDADTAKTDVAQTFTAAQRGQVTTDNDLSFDLGASNNFSCTPAGNGTLTFNNLVAGQSGLVLLNNSGAYTISAAATTKLASGTLAAISAAGTYLLTYFCDGTNVYVVASGALT